MAVWQTFYSFRRGQQSNNIASPGFPIDFEAGASPALKIALINNATAPLVATHEYWDDLNAGEMDQVGPFTNYTPGGFTLTMVLGPKGATVNVDSDDPTWAQNAGGFSTAYYAVLYKDSGTPSTSPLIAFNDITGPKGNVSGPLTLTTTTGLFDQTQT